MKRRLAPFVYLLASLALHVVLVRASTGAPRPPSAMRPPAIVQLSVVSPAQPVPTPPAPQVEPPAAAPAKPKPKAASAPLDAPPAAVEAREPAPAELTGNTLVAAGDAGWAAPSGSGSERDGAIGAGLARSVNPQPVAPAAPVAAPAAALVPLAQLARKPVPPPLSGVLKRYYPKAARDQGLSGDAKVRARIEPSGDVRAVTITSETAAGFGDACRRTLLASKWSAPLNDAGRAVATYVAYRCRFRVED